MRTEEQIKFILEDFDFERVRKVMKALDWKYDREKGIPTIKQLKSVARAALKNVSEERPIVSMGGFEAEMVSEKDTGTGFGSVLELRFIIDRVNPLSEMLK